MAEIQSHALYTLYYERETGNGRGGKERKSRYLSTPRRRKTTSLRATYLALASLYSGYMPDEYKIHFHLLIVPIVIQISIGCGLDMRFI